MDDDLLVPKPPVGITWGLIRQRDKAHVGSIWLNRDIDYEFEDPVTGQRHASPIPRDIIWVVIRARGEEICRLRIPTAELLGDRPYEPVSSPNVLCQSDSNGRLHCATILPLDKVAFGWQDGGTVAAAMARVGALPPRRNSVMSSSHPSPTPEPSIVMVPVPVHRLTEVYELLGRPPAAEAPRNEPDGDGGSSGSAWSAGDLARLHQTLGRDAVARAFLDFCSERPEQPVWYGELCERLGRSHPSVRSGLGGFTRLLKSRFGRDDWPFRAEWVDGKALYTVDTETARAWLRVSGQDQEAAT